MSLDPTVLLLPYHLSPCLSTSRYLSDIVCTANRGHSAMMDVSPLDHSSNTSLNSVCVSGDSALLLPAHRNTITPVQMLICRGTSWLMRLEMGLWLSPPLPYLDDTVTFLYLFHNWSRQGDGTMGERLSRCDFFLVLKVILKLVLGVYHKGLR